MNGEITVSKESPGSIPSLAACLCPFYFSIQLLLRHGAFRAGGNAHLNDRSTFHSLKIRSIRPRRYQRCQRWIPPLKNARAAVNRLSCTCTSAPFRPFSFLPTRPLYCPRSFPLLARTWHPELGLPGQIFSFARVYSVQPVYRRWEITIVE